MGTLQSLMTADPLHWAKKDFVRVLGEAAPKLNRRYRETKKYADTPAVLGLEESGGRIKTKSRLQNMTINQLRKEYKRAQNFYSAKTSTVRGAKQMQGEILGKTGYDFRSGAEAAVDGSVMSEADWQRMWDVFHRLDDEHHLVNAYNYKYVINMLAERVQTNPNSRISDLVRHAKRQLDRQYEAEEREWQARLEAATEAASFSYEESGGDVGSGRDLF